MNKLTILKMEIKKILKNHELHSMTEKKKLLSLTYEKFAKVDRHVMYIIK